MFGIKRFVFSVVSGSSPMVAHMIATFVVSGSSPVVAHMIATRGLHGR